MHFSPLSLSDENHETSQIQAKGPSGEGRRPKWIIVYLNKKIIIDMGLLNSLGQNYNKNKL